MIHVFRHLIIELCVLIKHFFKKKTGLFFYLEVNILDKLVEIAGWRVKVHPSFLSLSI